VPSGFHLRFGAGILIAALLVAASAVITYRSTARFLDSARWVEAARDIDLRLEEVVSQLKDIETGSRGYVLTGDEAFLDPYKTGVAIIDDGLNVLRGLLAVSPEQLHRLDQLDGLITRRLAWAHEVIQAGGHGGFDTAVRKIKQGTGNVLTEQIRSLVREMRAAQSDSLRQRQAVTELEAHRTMQTFALLMAMVVALLTAVAYLVWRNLAAQERARADLQAAYDELDRRVEQRTLELAESNRRLREEIAERENTRRALKDTEALTETIVNTAVDGLVMIDEGGCIESFNPAAERMFGYAAHEVLGQSISLLMPEPFRSEHDRYIERYLVTGEESIIGAGREVTGRRKDGVTFAMDLAVGKAQLGARRLFTGIMRDITERKRAEAQLQELQRAAHQRERLVDVGAITAQIVHDLGNPLAAVSMQAQLILKRAGRDGGQPITSAVPSVERILTEIRRLDSLVKEFMEFTREQRLDLRKLDVDAFLTQITDLWQPVAAAHDILLTVTVPPDLPQLTVDEEKLRRVFDNLIKNAIEAIDHGPGRVEVEVTLPAPAQMRFTVADTGPGISDAVQAFRLFETTKRNGSGLGLPVTREIILAHRGTIDYAGRELRGTVFRVELPVGGPRSG
jgi:two-component system sensor kinase FixL